MYDISVEYKCLEEAEEVSENVETETINLRKIINSNGQERYEANLDKNILLKSFKIARFTSRQDFLLLKVDIKDQYLGLPFFGAFGQVINLEASSLSRLVEP